MLRSSARHADPGRLAVADRMRVKLRRGLDIPIPGAPRQTIERAPETRSVALLGHDLPRAHYVLRVSPDDRVRTGQVLFVDRRRPEVVFTSPASGVVTRTQHGDGREPIAVVIEVDAREEAGAGPSEVFPACPLEEAVRLDRAEVTRRLLAAGEWPSLRVRPFGSIPDPGSVPDALFIRAMDTSPLAPRASVVWSDRLDDFRIGTAVLSRLHDGPVFVCCDPGSDPPVADLDRVRVVQFEGPHPAGLAGTHIHHLFPIRDGRAVWYLGYQETLAIGHLFRTGRVDLERVVALAGPLVRNPRLLRTRVGSSTEDLVRDELLPGECRIISGSLLSGRRAATAESHLGRGHEQISVVPEEPDHRKTSWLLPGLLGARRVPPWRRPAGNTTALHGAARAMLPLHLFENAVPLRIPITLLLRSLAAGDFESARAFGALELEEEDLALCSYLCAAKLEYGELLRSALDAFGAGPR